MPYLETVLHHTKDVEKLEVAYNLIIPQGFAYALRRTTEMKERLNYLSCCLDAFKGQIPTDILVKPGNNGPSIAAHKSLLSANSVVFKFMLDSDGCKAPPGHTITLEELSYLELHALLEFLYRAGLPEEKLETHIYALSVAADKYEIKLLQIRCENHMLTTLNTSNALEHLEISDTHKSYPHLKVAAMSFIVNNVEGIVFTPKFDSFAVKNPHLALQITRASVIATNKQKKRRV
ncbi:BTB/POZ domain-containing protein At3g56230-like [Lycium ferocissimum]|uniref:BTB/POZ domain-containing protein At3g56230-like n=1 Tax=Lycium ferocissimum TaxID=112874 RepID=UPI0028158067|nr:BTB/POZ domain-containing protein At3g56230-like [Lycium ferocissimum]